MNASSLTDLYEQNKTLLFTLLVLTFSFFTLMSEEFLITENHYYEHFRHQLNVDRIESMLEFRETWKWVNYAAIPIVFLLKFAMLTTWILVGIIFFGYRASFKSLFHIVLVSEFVFLFPVLIKVIWFGIIDTQYTLADVSYFTPLSLASLFDISNMDPWWVYPLRSINVFEVVYLLVLSFGIQRIIRKRYHEAIRFTIPVYGSGLLIWIIFITFLTLNFS